MPTAGPAHRGKPLGTYGSVVATVSRVDAMRLPSGHAGIANDTIQRSMMRRSGTALVPCVARRSSTSHRQPKVPLEPYRWYGFILWKNAVFFVHSHHRSPRRLCQGPKPLALRGPSQSSACPDERVEWPQRRGAHRSTRLPRCSRRRKDCRFGGIEARTAKGVQLRRSDPGSAQGAPWKFDTGGTGTDRGSVGAGTHDSPSLSSPKRFPSRLVGRLRPGSVS